MRTHQILFVPIAALLFIVASLLTSCSDLKSDLPPSVSGELKVHDAGWSDSTSANFHGKVLKQIQYKFDGCVSCHSKQFTGGVTGVSCLKCHQSYPHLPGWENPTSSGSHGRYLKAKSWQLSECTSCHGSSFTGGTSGQSCFTCHTAYPHPANFASGSVHPPYLYNQNYPLTQCQDCHGTSYAGSSVTNITCMKSGCHVDSKNTPKSPEACNTCHGVFSAAANDFLSGAPPTSVLGETAPTARGVGAHQKHLLTGVLGKALKCQECHTVPSQVSSPGHLGTLPAEVVLNDTLARLTTGGGTYVPKPSYDPSSLKCNNTYCHGNWKLRKVTSSSQFAYTDSVMVGTNYSPVWTGGSAEATCGSCHGIPPQGHIKLDVSTCGTCHYGIVSADRKIIDKPKHTNGKVNVFGQEYSF